MSSCYNKALHLLSRREHSRFELRRKLLASTACEDANLDELLDKLIDDGWQSDERCAESLVRVSLDKGFGSFKIQQKMRDIQLPNTCINRYLHDANINWFSLAEKARQKRFGDSIPDDFALRAKQMRFLQGRGFSHDIIRQVVS